MLGRSSKLYEWFQFYLEQRILIAPIYSILTDVLTRLYGCQFGRLDSVLFVVESSMYMEDHIEISSVMLSVHLPVCFKYPL